MMELLRSLGMDFKFMQGTISQVVVVMSEPFLGILASIQTFNLIIWQQKTIAKVFAIVFT